MKRAQIKEAVRRPAPMLECPPPDRPSDVVSNNILQLPACQEGSKYLLVCVDRLSLYVVVAPLKDKPAKPAAHALVTHLFCANTAKHVLLSVNEQKFRNHLVKEISKQVGIKHCFTVNHHPGSKGLVEWAKTKILEVFHLTVGGLLEQF